ncbi:MAG: rod shape-determining protein RodA [Abditibacteriota bacterium]|nr:rod shape-determining protein RodA [Abditibacteriota bacterium]
MQTVIFRYYRYFDRPLATVTLLLCMAGLAAIYSAAGAEYLKKQAFYLVTGAGIAWVISGISIPILTKLAGKLYGFTFTLLLLVLLMGSSVNGARRWINLGIIQLQPSELAKAALIVCLAVYLSSRRHTAGTPKVFLGSLVYIGVPMLLIFRQPDLGTSLTLAAMWLVMVFVCGCRLRHILLFLLITAALAAAAWWTPGVLKPYQKDRIYTFLNPQSDPLGAGYHVIQSRIAIGSGGLWGKGYLKGTQKTLDFIPEQHTDFVWTVFGEEFGFAGCLVILLLYFILIFRLIHIMLVTEDDTGRAIAAGVCGLLSFHIIVNIGMTMGIMPVTGMPLPFISYGGTALWGFLAEIGLAEGVSMRRRMLTL